jgi:hypothetical protein
MMATATTAIEVTVVATAMPTIAAEPHGAESLFVVFFAYTILRCRPSELPISTPSGNRLMTWLRPKLLGGVGMFIRQMRRIRTFGRRPLIFAKLANFSAIRGGNAPTF